MAVLRLDLRGFGPPIYRVFEGAQKSDFFAKNHKNVTFLTWKNTSCFAISIRQTDSLASRAVLTTCTLQNKGVLGGVQKRPLFGQKALIHPRKRQNDVT